MMHRTGGEGVLGARSQKRVQRKTAQAQLAEELPPINMEQVIHGHSVYIDEFIQAKHQMSVLTQGLVLFLSQKLQANLNFLG